ncbi:MAG: AraC family transcriptional regulator [Proteobacteria bacterium]|nr:AraC family transcriptional regulator [Pseudomonadota bacterium]
MSDLSRTMSLTDRALWVIDRNLGPDLDLAAIARACGVSRHHLAHAFGEATGTPVMAYVRARRLGEAARALADGARDILALALAAGYGSHEAFTRAFRRAFGRTPEAVRRSGAVDGLALAELSVAAAPGPVDLAPPVVRRAGPILAAGLSRRHAFGALEGIPGQWRAFMPGFGELAGARPIPIGVLGPADAEGRFDYLCAAEEPDPAGLPAGLRRLRLPARDYAVFDHAGHVSTVRATYAAIWNNALADAGLTPAAAPSLERHNASFDPATGLGGLTLWIPLERG